MMFSVVEETAITEPFAYPAFSPSGPRHRNRLIHFPRHMQGSNGKVSKDKGVIQTSRRNRS